MGWNACSQEESERLTLLASTRDTPTPDPGELLSFLLSSRRQLFAQSVLRARAARACLPVRTAFALHCKETLPAVVFGPVAFFLRSFLLSPH